MVALANLEAVPSVQEPRKLSTEFPPNPCSDPVKVGVETPEINYACVARDHSAHGAQLMPPPGLMAPPGLATSNASMESLRNVDLALEAQRLQEENVRLMNDRLELESARLAQENALLRARLQTQQMMAISACPGSPQTWGPPGFFSPPLGNWGVANQWHMGSPRKGGPKSRTGTHSFSGSESSTTEGGVSERMDSSSSSGDETVQETTVMVRNIPNSYTRDRLLQLFDEQGFKCLYDMVYLPIDFTSHSGLGYAFVNLISAEDCAKFRDHFHGFNDWGVFSEKACDAQGSATHQGLSANVERYRNSPVMHDTVSDQFRPAMFKNGVRIPFPPPTRRIRAPDLRRRSLSSEDINGACPN